MRPIAAILFLALAVCLPALAADVPSGLDADTGEPRPVAVRAHVTAAMGFVKRGCRTPVGRAYAGRTVEIDIGLPRALHGAYLL